MDDINKKTQVRGRLEDGVKDETPAEESDHHRPIPEPTEAEYSPILSDPAKNLPPPGGSGPGPNKSP